MCVYSRCWEAGTDMQGEEVGGRKGRNARAGKTGSSKNQDGEESRNNPDKPPRPVEEPARCEKIREAR